MRTKGVLALSAWAAVTAQEVSKFPPALSISLPSDQRSSRGKMEVKFSVTHESKENGLIVTTPILLSLRLFNYQPEYKFQCLH